MKRLVEEIDEELDNLEYYDYYTSNNKGVVDLSDAIDKLSQLEDIMEKYNIDTIRKFEICIEEYNISIREKSRYKNLVDKLIKENQELKSQFKNAIVPRFKINQTVYFFNDCYVMASGQIGDIKTHKSYCGDDECENFVSYTIYVDNNSYSTDYERDEQYVFATKEEAEKKLEELRK